MRAGKYIDIVFIGPPPSGRLVEVEDENRRSVRVGEWLKRDDGYWVLRLRTLEHLANSTEGEKRRDRRGKKR